MTLLVDVGNTRVKWCVAHGDRLGVMQSADHGGGLVECAEGMVVEPRPESIWIASVWSPADTTAFGDALARRFDVPVKIARTQAEADGLRCAYDDPARLGVDRWLTMRGLWAGRRDAFCVVSAGTALTVDAVDATGQHLGGLIAPGLRSLLRATLGATRFDAAQPALPDVLELGRDTEACVAQGALHAAVGCIEAACRGHDGARILCGGDASTLIGPLGAPWQIESDAVLAGLAVAATASKPRSGI